MLADIRAPRVAEGLCPVLLDGIAQDCAVNAAHVVEGSVDAVAGTAMFQLDLVYRLKDDGAELPDLAAHVLQSEAVRLDLDARAEGAASPAAALARCWPRLPPPAPPRAWARLVVLIRLDSTGFRAGPYRPRPGSPCLIRCRKGMFVAPPLDPATGG